MEKNAYDKMKQLLKWNDENIRMKMVAKEQSRVRNFRALTASRTELDLGCWRWAGWSVSGVLKGRASAYLKYCSQGMMPGLFPARC